MKLQDKILRWHIMEAHARYIRRGQYHEARRILHMLINGKITLGLSDIDWSTQCILEPLGCYIYTSRNGNRVTVYPYPPRKR